MISALPKPGIGVAAWRPNLLFWLRTIRSRLYLAFGLAAGMTVVGALVALYASGNISTTLTDIVSRSMPATVESLRLSEEARSLVASAPQLMTAEDDGQRNEIALGIAGQIGLLDGRIERLRELDSSQNDELEVAKSAMTEQLDALNQAVADRIKISDRRRELVLSVRKRHEKLLEAITSAVDDANFDLMTKAPAPEDRTTLNKSIDKLRRLLEIESASNLLVGLLIEASMAPDIASLSPKRDLIASARRSIEANLKALPDSPELRIIADLYRRLAAAAEVL